jgi:hypothetical protein
VVYVDPAPPWEVGHQAILNSTGARVPEHTFNQPVPITARIVWADDGEEFIETVAAGRSGQNVYVRLRDRRYRLASVWLKASDVSGAEPAHLFPTARTEWIGRAVSMC